MDRWLFFCRCDTVLNWCKRILNVSQPEVTQCGWLDVKIQELTKCYLGTRGSDVHPCRAGWLGCVQRSITLKRSFERTNSRKSCVWYLCMFCFTYVCGLFGRFDMRKSLHETKVLKCAFVMTEVPYWGDLCGWEGVKNPVTDYPLLKSRGLKM